MELKVLTLNIWRYYNWRKRKKKLINLLKLQNPDIIFLQEVAYDSRLRGKFKNQIDEINKQLKYDGGVFKKMTKMTRWHEKPIDWKMWYGLGVLSKFPIKKSELIVLPHIKKKKNFGFLHSIVKINKKIIDLINVHFENTDEGSIEHLKQTLDWCRNKNIKPIIAGDFNIKKTKQLIKLTEKNYYISYKIKPYFSFMPTKFSHNKEPITLDYILAAKQKFVMRKVECIQTNISDHKPVVAVIKIKD